MIGQRTLSAAVDALGRMAMAVGVVAGLYAVPVAAIDTAMTPVAASQPVAYSPTAVAVPANILAQPGRPRIGLVLGGGGAKGFAHIGVIAELERLHIPVDVVAGTSMGAVVGSLYAGGRNAQQLTEVAHSIDWVTVFSDTIHRDDLSLRRKSDERNILLPYRLSFKDGSPILPKGVLGGQKLYMTLQSLLLPNRALDNFDNFAIPFRAVASNIATGQHVVMGTGDITSAVFASMAVPAGFPPVEREGLLLVDGMISDNVPVDVAREMGVDVVIVVNVGSPPMHQDQINNAINVFSQMQLLLGNDAVVRQLASLKGKDVLISPDIEGLSTTSFDKVDVGITRGQLAAQAVRDKLALLSVSDAEWAAYQAAKARRVQDQPIIARTVTVDNSSSIPTKELDAMITTKPGEVINAKAMMYDIGNIYSLAEFDRVYYQLGNGPGTDRDLVVHAKGDPTQLRFFQFGFLMGSSLGKNSTFEIAAGYTDRNFMGTGAEWRGFGKVGTNITFRVELYKQFGPWFVEPFAEANRFNSTVANIDGANTLGVLRYNQINSGVTGGYVFGNWGDIRAGVRAGGVTELKGSLPTGLAPGWNRDIAWSLGFHVDTLDSLIFPTKGVEGTLLFTDHVPALGGELTAEQVEFSGNWALTRGRTSLVLGAHVGTTFNANVDFVGPYKLGGLFNLSGYTANSLIGQQEVFGRAIVFHRLNQPAPILNLPIYVGGSLEFGNIYNTLDDFSIGSLHTAFSGFVAVDTPIGPAYFAYGHAGGNNNAIYLIIGRVF
jgi:NTE family protein